MGVRNSYNWGERDRVVKLLGFDDYKSYLKSDMWRDIRLEVMHEANRQCECGARATAVHHNRYTEENLSGKSYVDLQAICQTCHEKAHGLANSKPPVNRLKGRKKRKERDRRIKKVKSMSPLERKEARKREAKERKAKKPRKLCDNCKASVAKKGKSLCDSCIANQQKINEDRARYNCRNKRLEEFRRLRKSPEVPETVHPKKKKNTTSKRQARRNVGQVIVKGVRRCKCGGKSMKRDYLCFSCREELTKRIGEQLVARHKSQITS